MADEKKDAKPKPCCVCLDEKKERDACLLQNGQDSGKCDDIIGKYKIFGLRERGVAPEGVVGVIALAGVAAAAHGEVRVLDEVVDQDQAQAVHEDRNDEDHHEDLEVLGELVEPLEENVAGDPEQRFLEPVHDEEHNALRHHHRREVDRQALQVCLEARLVWVRAVLAGLDVGQLEPVGAHPVDGPENAVQDVDADGAVKHDVEEVPVAGVVVDGVLRVCEAADGVSGPAGLDNGEHDIKYVDA